MPYELTERDYTEGLWFYRPDEAWPPESLSRPEEYEDSSRLSLSLQADSSRARTKLIRGWCDALSTLDKVAFLWILGTVNQDLLNAVCRMPSLEGLWAKNTSFSSLKPIPEAPALRFLSLRNLPRVDSLAPLAAARNLLWLELENTKRVRDLQPLAQLGGLQGLAVCGSMWTTQHVQTLEPLQYLEDLRYLSIVNLRSDDKSLRWLFALNRLRHFSCAQWWDADEVNVIRGNNRGLAV